MDLLAGRWAHVKTLNSQGKDANIPFGAYRINEDGRVQYAYESGGKWHIVTPDSYLKEIEGKTYIVSDASRYVYLIESVTETELVTLDCSPWLEEHTTRFVFKRC